MRGWLRSVALSCSLPPSFVHPPSVHRPSDRPASPRPLSPPPTIHPQPIHLSYSDLKRQNQSSLRGPCRIRIRYVFCPCALGRLCPNARSVRIYLPQSIANFDFVSRSIIYSRIPHSHFVVFVTVIDFTEWSRVGHKGRAKDIYWRRTLSFGLVSTGAV